MAAPPDRFVQRALALLLPLGPVEARRMFGGHGLYLEGTIFGLLFDGALYLKADEETKGEFEKRGFAQLTYEGGKGRVIGLPYWQTPKSFLKDGKTLLRWARKAYAAGQRADAKKKPKTAAAKARKKDDAAQTKTAAARLKPGRRPRYKPDF